MNSKRQLTRSVLFSIVFHVAALIFLLSKPLHFSPRLWTHIGKTHLSLMAPEEIAKLKRNRALEEAFDHFELSPFSTVKAPVTEGAKSSFLIPEIALAFPQIPLASISDLPTPFLNDLPVTFEPQAPRLLPLLTDPSVCHVQDIDPKDYRASLPKQSSLRTPYPFPVMENAQSLELASLRLPNLQSPSPTLSFQFRTESPSQISLPSKQLQVKLKPEQEALIAFQDSSDLISALERYGFSTLPMKNWNDYFEVGVKIYPKEEGGFFFSVSLIPLQDLSEHRLKQNYIFMIDRSNSVDKHRYQTFKRAVSRAMTALKEGDCFNILLLDSSITQLSPTPIPFNRSHQQKAQAFLDQQTYQSYGRATDIYAMLKKMTMPVENEEQAVTAIFISDGDSPRGVSKHRKKMNRWLNSNRNLVTVYTATAGQGNNLSSLKMLGLASRGTLLYSDTYAAFPRKLAQLIIDLRFPIGKEMTFSVIDAPEASQIELFPPSSRLPYLLSDRPFVLVGSCLHLTDFTLVLEGKNKHETIAIKKTIPLSKAKPGSKLLAKQWQAEQANHLLVQTLNDVSKNSRR